MLFEVFHIQVSDRLDPVLVHFHGERPNQPQTGFDVREDAHDQGPPFDFFIQPLQQIRRFQVFVMLPR
jgi:hypothetical protein